MKLRDDEILGYLLAQPDLGPVCVQKCRDRRVTLSLDPSSLRNAVSALKENCPCLRFITISAVDTGLDIEYLYHFDIDGVVVTVRIVTPKEENILHSISDVVPASRFIEREIADLLGVKIHNHSQPECLFLTKDWPDDQRAMRRPKVGEVPTKTRPLVEALIRTSCIAPITNFMQQRREKAGLPALPPLALQKEASLEEFQEILRNTELDKKTGFD